MGEYVARHAAVEGPGPWSKPGSVAFRLESQCWLNRRAGREIGRHRPECVAERVVLGRGGVAASRRVVVWRAT